MNSKKSSYRGFGIYLLLILAIVGIWYWMDGNTSTNTYTRASFEKALASGQVVQINIMPNREVPTGNARIIFSDNTTQVLTVTDVGDFENYLQQQNFSAYTVENPPEESWLLTLLPYLIIFAAMFIFFMIMTNQAAANSGGGSRMMNFGKSRAKLMTDDPARRVTFDKVAGLAKHALLREVGSPAASDAAAAFEEELLAEVNALGIGPAALGGSPTAVAVHLETAPCHIAALPVAVNMGCCAMRSASVRLV